MSNAIRSAIRQKIAHSLDDASASKLADISASLRFKRDASKRFAFRLPLRTASYDIRRLAGEISRSGDAEIVAEDALSYVLPRDATLKSVLENNARRVGPPLHLAGARKVLVEFSSPNIAKPFHVGHLRSTVIGNYLANLHDFLEDETVRINYLGDWGTQFGFVQLGMELTGVPEEDLRADPINVLYKAYVRANESALDDPSVAERARRLFERLENGDEALERRWHAVRQWTGDELAKTYARLGVRFDEYHWESTYNSRNVRKVLARMDDLDILRVDEHNRRVAEIAENNRVPVVKSDGSTLYLTRDVAAALDRYEQFQFDLMYYVVENAQNKHFTNLHGILEKMEKPLAERIRHVKFGKIRGMSTRRGNAVFLSDFLDEARDTMIEKQRNTSTTKVSFEPSDTSADTLGISAVIIHDLKQKRLRDYDFDWNVALDEILEKTPDNVAFAMLKVGSWESLISKPKGETGVRLQYCHCRLVNLEENCGATLPIECDPSLLQESIVDELVTKIIQFDEAIVTSYRTLEACHLTKYLFDLSHVANRALGQLRVKGEPSDVAAQRLLLYRCARNVLAKGMRLLGLRPLEKM